MKDLTPKALFLKVIEEYLDGIGSPEYDPNTGNLEIAKIVILSKPDDTLADNLCEGMSQEVGNEVMCAIGDFCAYNELADNRLLDYIEKYCAQLFKDLMDNTYIKTINMDVDDSMADAEALASAGMGTDEDYGGTDERC
jgi:hypothetical protein